MAFSKCASYCESLNYGADMRRDKWRTEYSRELLKSQLHGDLSRFVRLTDSTNRREGGDRRNEEP